MADGVFATTHWSVVLAAAHKSSPTAQAALEELCRTYWYPLYVYLRKSGQSEHDAQDLTQGFFAQILERDSLAKVSPERGRFRSFLLASLRLFVADQRDHARAAKRGGGRPAIALDALDAETRYRLEPIEEQNPERLFERRWAMTVLDEVLRRLRGEFEAQGKSELFNQIHPFLGGDKSHGTYEEIARRRGVSESAIKMSVLRMRIRYQELFREVVTDTVATSAEVEDELRHLASAIRG